MLDALTLDQLRVLAMIAETGSFTAAARRLGRTQSAISHAVATLESELRIALFDRSERRPRLTDAGRAVLADARLALARIDQLKTRARGLADGVESEIRLAITVLAPLAPVIELLERFRSAFPAVCLELFVEEIGGAALLVHERVCQIGLSGSPSLRLVPAGDLVTIPVGSVDVVAVARTDHPLLALGRPLTQEDLNEHLQLVPTSRARAAYPNTLAREVWRVSDLVMRRDMMLSGIGWGTVPRHLVVEDLVRGRFVELNLASRPPELMRADLFVIHRADTASGPAARWLIAEMAALMEHNRLVG
jgi:DNA-binding transcriptional LysR family regulator